MEKNYQLIIHPNWGLSRANVVDFGNDYAKALEAYNKQALGGAGNVVAVYLKLNGENLMAKWLKEE